jgi:hypothetical protein
VEKNVASELILYITELGMDPGQLVGLEVGLFPLAAGESDGADQGKKDCLSTDESHDD